MWSPEDDLRATGDARFSHSQPTAAAELVVGIVALLVPIAEVSADTYAPLSLPELIEIADLVVVGEAQGQGDVLVVRAKEVLKGPSAEVFPARGRFGMGRCAFKSGSKGVFFLRKSKRKIYFAFHPACFQKPEKEDYIRTLFEMIRDPGPYVDLKRHPENPDFVHILGSAFAGYRISSKEVSELPVKMRNFAVRYYEVVPWNEKRAVVLRCTYDPDRGPSLVVESASPQGKLAAFLGRRLRTASNWEYVRAILKPRFAVKLDTRWPSRVGSLSVEKAVAYLRGRLGSTDREVIRAALLALGKMRDLESVPLAIRLIDHVDTPVATVAVKFLQWARDERAVAPLCRVLDRAKPDDAGDRQRAMVSACTKALMYVRHAEAVPSLESLVDRGLGGCWAFIALGRVGAKSSFDVLLNCAGADPSRNMMCLDGLYWLVRRSNLSVEPWMANPSLSASIAREKLPKWQAWWGMSRSRFRIAASYEEALTQKHR